MSSGKLKRLFDQYTELSVLSGIFLSYLILHVIFQRHELMAYDLYTYTSFGQHYAENWFYTVLPGQAHGLEIVSYPPLLFQIMALLSFIPFLGQKWLSIFLVSLGATALSYFFYSFVVEIVDVEIERPEVLMIFTAFSPGLLKFSLIHGQLPFIIGMGLAFAASRSYYRSLKGEEKVVRFASFLLLTAFVHHFSFLMLSIVVSLLTLLNFRDFVERIDYLIPSVVVSSTIIAVGLLPTIRETLFGISQGVIWHGSRNPLEYVRIFNQYVTTTYGITALGLLLVIEGKERFHQLNIIALSFLTIGLGLVTPTPEILFAGMSDFLVYDRFSLVSSLFLTSLIAFKISGLERKIRKIPVSRILIVTFVIISLVTLFWANNIHTGAFTGYGESDPEQTREAIEYLDQNASSEFLYMTLGHNPPAAEIRVQTDIPTLDTGYFQGRKHGILEDQGRFDRLSGAEFQEVKQSADNLSLKYVLVFDESNKWFNQNTEWEMKRLDEGVSIWLNPDADKYEPDLGKRRFLFGIFPLVILSATSLIILSARIERRIERLLGRLRDSMASTIKERNLKHVWLSLILVPLVAALPSFITSGYPAGIDTPAHIFKPQLMQQMIRQHGQLFFWTDLWYNGYPFRAMYPPLSTLLIYYLDSLLKNITLAYNIIRFGVLAATSVVVYSLAGNITRDTRIRLAGSFLSVFSYPLYLNLYTVGRLASAMSLPLYLFIINLALRDDIFQRKVSRGHFYLGASAGLLFLLHSMMAYLFLYTAAIFCLVYWRKVRKIGVKPVLVTVSIPIMMASSYLVRLIQHLAIRDTSWYVLPVEFEIADHLVRSFDLVPPSYLGWITAAMFVVGVLNYWRESDRFFRFTALNFVFFYVAFWARNFKNAFFLPLSGQFDLSRFEILFTIFAILIAIYGIKYLVNEYLVEVAEFRKSVLILCMLTVVFVLSSPMLIHSANWQPEFEDEMSKVDVNTDYRAIGVDMRQWHTYLIWEMDLANTFGWFNQADPNPYFRKSLQRSGGRWHGWNFVQDIENENYRNNLMELSNTKYVVSAEGEWMRESRSMQVKGLDKLNHHLNEQFIKSLEESEKYRTEYSSENLKVLSFRRNMSRCEPVNPVWIQEDYMSKADQMLTQSRMLPEIPVNSSDPGRTGNATRVECTSKDPYTRVIEAEEPGWVLLKESYHPFWERKDGGRIYDGFGFMVMYVEDSTELKYRPRSIGTLSIDDVRSALTG